MQVQANWENQLLALAGNIPHPHTRPFFSYWAGDASLRKAYKQAEKITAQHSKSFYFASGLLPEEKRLRYVLYMPFAEPWMILWINHRMPNGTAQLDYWRAHGGNRFFRR